MKIEINTEKLIEAIEKTPLDKILRPTTDEKTLNNGINTVIRYINDAVKEQSTHLEIAPVVLNYGEMDSVCYVIKKLSGSEVNKHIKSFYVFFAEAYFIKPVLGIEFN